MQPPIGLLFLLLALTVMFFLVRGWDAVREQFGAQLQNLFTPRDEPPAAAINAQGRRRHADVPRAHTGQLSDLPAHFSKWPGAPRTAERHRPTARHH
jgi:hypothetical protein